jgi:antitoxin component of RelBE/YafQ-DinJ toxin-antitoxin module
METGITYFAIVRNVMIKSNLIKFHSCNLLSNCYNYIIMNRTILQIPVSRELKITAENVALGQGFSSLQEAVRIFLNKLAQGSMQITFEETTQLSKNAIIKYNAIVKDVENKKNVFIANNVNDLMNKLHDAS